MSTDTMIAIDAVDAIELSEICELISDWLTASHDAAASYDHHIGQPGSALELQADLARLATVLITAKLVQR